MGESRAEGGGAPEIEITPEMIEAGFCVLLESGAIETPMEDLERSLVQKIFVAMFHAQRSLS
jgi:hypothetical protein